MSYKRKLIEVNIPLTKINEASIREKSIRHGHPSTLHLWWSRKPLATCRAVLFTSLVDDPSAHPELFPTEKIQKQERDRLFRLIEDLVLWENSNNADVLEKARKEIKKYAGETLPAVLDPFAGGGSIPLEAQRLGLRAHARDLNPVAVLLNKAMMELPAKFARRPPINPDEHFDISAEWQGARGLAHDIRYYGKWMRREAQKRIGHLYPRIQLPAEYGHQEANVIAWLWARTVTCPNPACGIQAPLASKWWLSKKKGKEARVEPIIDQGCTPPRIRYTVLTGKGEPQDGTVNRRGGTCIVCGTPLPFEYIREEGKQGRMGEQLMAIVADGPTGRVYLAPTEDHIQKADVEPPYDIPDTCLPEQALGFRVQLYGMTKHKDLFTNRQLVALATFSDLVQEAREQMVRDAQRTSDRDDRDIQAYADAVATYLALAVDRLADRNSSICSWDSTRDSTRNTFARQALPMVWDFAEANPFSESTGNFLGAVDWVAEAIEISAYGVEGSVKQQDATSIVNGVTQPVISTDPPYYDNIGYADLSDFFYIWLRRSLHPIYPELFGTMLVPKAEELVATPYRFGGDKRTAQRFFEVGLGKAFQKMREVQHPDYPLTVYYAFKQGEAEEDEQGNGTVHASTGWETMLEGLIRAGFMITGTWPMRTELANRTVGHGTNALASSIVLVCRPREVNAPIASRREFLNALRRELPHALKELQSGNIAPVDLAQASIGPGIAIYSRYSKVVEADGTSLKVRTALQLINQVLDEFLTEQEGEYDPETRWAIAWYENNAMKPGLYGEAETLSKAKNTSVQAMKEAGIVEATGGKVRLLRADELPSEWNPTQAHRYSVWTIMLRLIDSLDKKGERSTSALLRQVGEQGELARDLAYHLYNLCERKGWAQEGMAFNSLVASWSEIRHLESKAPGEQIKQQSLM
ncbi:putative DNA methylase [Thermosporothrix hazakensis]|uniref:Putative DNA methylase n=1 Tax=Thermosporothrix hazakensis TaxID=644383 RepID=A0A326U7Q1_THEHA|nr:DUF1156 domain-containing protein [Thermosporothrix hazakensis]PZW27102.1 putative DNA methylase [Thermosporothrix hazakensis]GCE50385.1 hypothetical protein KTH_52540 [Thermosporothrix hazakensis]